MIRNRTTSLLLGFLLANVAACTVDQKKNPIVENTFNLDPYLKQLDSSGIDIKSDSLLYQVGYQNLYFGKNERGNALMEYAMSNMDSIHAELYRHWSVQNTKNGNYAKAIELLEEAMKLDAKHTSRYYGWVLLYYYRDYEMALEILNQFDAYTPNFADAPMGEDIHYLKGLCYMQMNKPEQALREFSTYINNMASENREDYVDVYAFVQRGRCLKRLEKYEEALGSFSKAIQYYENCSEAYYFMGLTQVEMGDKSAARESFNQSLKLLQKGYKSSDSYVEYFHEIYPQQVEEALSRCN